MLDAPLAPWTVCKTSKCQHVGRLVVVTDHSMQTLCGDLSRCGAVVEDPKASPQVRARDHRALAHVLVPSCLLRLLGAYTGLLARHAEMARCVQWCVRRWIGSGSEANRALAAADDHNAFGRG